MADYGLQVFNNSGSLIFDSNTHRAMKYIRTIYNPSLATVSGDHKRYLIPEMILSKSFVTIELVSGYIIQSWLVDGEVHLILNEGSVINLHLYKF